MSSPNIVEFADSAASAAGIESLTPAWSATLKLAYGLPLADDDVEFLTTATGRSRGSLRDCVGTEFAELWARVGRRGRKSSTISLVAVFEALYGGHEQHLIPGELGLVAVISKDLAGCGTVARFIESWLDAIGVGYSETTSGAMRLIPIEGTQLAIALLPCSSEAPRGPAIPVAILDEIAFWSTSEKYAQPDTEILSALRPAMAQFPRRKVFAISSPFGEDGVHFTTIDRALGNDDERKTLAVEGPTWIWNPKISEATTHEIEPDEKKWSREFAAIPGATVSQALDRADLDACIVDAPEASGRCFCAIDASSLRGDAFSWLFIFEIASGVSVPVVRGIEGDDLRRYSMTEIVKGIARQCAELGCHTVFGDQRESASLSALFNAEGLAFTSYAWSETSKDAAFQTLRRLLRDRKISILNHEKTISQLRNVKAHLRPSGRTNYATNGLDYASAVITAVHAINDDKIRLTQPARIDPSGGFPNESRWDGFPNDSGFSDWAGF
jgi:hypothetical protein